MVDTLKQSIQKKNDTRTCRSRQRSLAQMVQIAGVGVHSGEHVTLRLVPAPVNTGIIFRRVDLPNIPQIHAIVSAIGATPRSTHLEREGVRVCTVEHLLAALSAYEIDNLYIDIDAEEVPILDGCSLAYIELIEQGQVVEQSEDRQSFELSQTLHFSEGATHLVAIPSSEFRISYTLDYPSVPAIGTQYYSALVNTEMFKSDLAPCRTFCLYEELEVLRENNLIQGGTLDSAVVVKGSEVLNEKGLRFPNEMVRHKVLDLIGDLSLVSFPFKAHIIAIRTGHSSNVAMARLIHNHIKNTYNMEKTADAHFGKI